VEISPDAKSESINASISGHECSAVLTMIYADPDSQPEHAASVDCFSKVTCDPTTGVIEEIFVETRGDFDRETKSANLGLSSSATKPPLQSSRSVPLSVTTASKMPVETVRVAPGVQGIQPNQGVLPRMLLPMGARPGSEKSDTAPPSARSSVSSKLPGVGHSFVVAPSAAAVVPSINSAALTLPVQSDATSAAVASGTAFPVQPTSSSGPSGPVKDELDELLESFDAQVPNDTKAAAPVSKKEPTDTAPLDSQLGLLDD
jgi:hypothetical protein